MRHNGTFLKSLLKFRLECTILLFVAGAVDELTGDILIWKMPNRKFLHLTSAFPEVILKIFIMEKEDTPPSGNQVINLHAAGKDVGSRSYMVSVDQNKENVRANKMQKSLRLMNIRRNIVLRDVTGKSGLNIVEAILAGNRDSVYLASLVDIRVKKTPKEIADSLQGWWREELLFELKASLKFYKLLQKDTV